MCSIGNEPANKGNLNVFSDGHTDFFPTVTYQSTCAMNMQRFPFDEQNCTFQFSSWSYPDEELSLDFYDGEGNNDVDLGHYQPSSDWSLVSTGASRNFHSDYGFDYYDLTFYMVIRRKPGFYLYVLVIPSLLLSLLTPGLFWIPPSRPDRTTLGIKDHFCSCCQISFHQTSYRCRRHNVKTKHKKLESSLRGEDVDLCAPPY